MEGSEKEVRKKKGGRKFGRGMELGKNTEMEGCGGRNGGREGREVSRKN